MHTVKILFNSSDFYSISCAVLLVSASTKLHLKNGGDGGDYGGFVRGRTFLHLLMGAEIQDNNSDLGFHEVALVVLNRLERVVSVLLQ